MSIYLLSRCVPLVSTYGHVFLCPLSSYYKIPSSLIFLSSFNAIPFILFIHIQAFATSPSFSESINLHNHALSVVNQIWEQNPSREGMSLFLLLSSIIIMIIIIIAYFICYFFHFFFFFFFPVLSNCPLFNSES